MKTRKRPGSRPAGTPAAAAAAVASTPTAAVPLFPGDVPGGKSLCRCAHRGDGSASAHAGPIGHGYCTVPTCTCPKFSWDRFIHEGNGEKTS
jgi:hypothetical protein